MQKALIVKKEWLDLILDRYKTYEMRSTRTNYRGQIFLIESGTGLIVGEAFLIGCSSQPIPKSKRLIKYHQVQNLDLLDKWPYAWRLSRAWRYKNPIPYNHPKGAVVWVNLPEDHVPYIPLANRVIPKRFTAFINTSDHART